MTMVENVVRDAARSLRAPEETPVFRTLRRRARRRRAASAVVVTLVLVGAVAVVAQSRRSVDRLEVVSDPTSTSVQRPRDSNRTDMVGDAPPIVLDHVGRYVWNSRVVLPYLPYAWSWSSELVGDGSATVTHERARPVQVPGGYSMRVTFEVTNLEGEPRLRLISSANGPDPGPPPGHVRIPDVMGLSEARARAALAAAELGIVVAEEGQPRDDYVVVAQSPTPSTDIRKHGVITITIGAPK